MVEASPSAAGGKLIVTIQGSDGRTATAAFTAAPALADALVEALALVVRQSLETLPSPETAAATRRGPMTATERRQAIRAALLGEGCGRSDRSIAEEFGAAPATVGRIRRELNNEQRAPRSPARVGG